MSKVLRPYQLEALTTLRKRLKETTHPLLVNASVGSGKSLLLSELLLTIERAGWRALCLTMNSTLIGQNAETYRIQGGNPGIYCAGLGEKNTTASVIFGSPHSVAQAIRNQDAIMSVPFQLIVIDEAHNLSPHEPDTMLMRIVNWYGYQAQLHGHKYRVVGLTGTPYRGKGISIVGPNEYFKEEVCSISTSWLIENGYLTKPYFGRTHVDSIDFSNCHVDSFGKFKHKDIEKALAKNERLTGEIMRELVSVIEGGRTGAFVFASTKNHCFECARSLPEGQWAVVTGDTPHDERIEILQKARDGVIKYLINVNVLTVGVDITSFDVAAFLRPTESLVLYTQAIGRILRLHYGKKSALILDWAGNLARHGDIDDPIINEALQPRDDDDEEERPFLCYTCQTYNSLYARRCCGMVDGKRCDHFFEFKSCPVCIVQSDLKARNDITARQCRSCGHELIDPNAKLTRHKPETYSLNVIKAEYKVAPQGNTSFPIINAKYYCAGAMVYESHFTSSKKSQNIFYAKFLRNHLDNASDYYMHLSNIHRMQKMIEEPTLKTPMQLICTKNEDGFYRIMKKVFSGV